MNYSVPNEDFTNEYTIKRNQNNGDLYYLDNGAFLKQIDNKVSSANFNLEYRLINLENKKRIENLYFKNCSINFNNNYYLEFNHKVIWDNWQEEDACILELRCAGHLLERWNLQKVVLYPNFSTLTITFPKYVKLVANQSVTFIKKHNYIWAIIHGDRLRQYSICIDENIDEALELFKKDYRYFFLALAKRIRD